MSIFTESEKNFLSSIGDTDIFIESSKSDRVKVLDKTIEVLESLGFNPKISKRSKIGWINENNSGDFEESLCISLGKLQGLESVCTKVNKEIKPLGAKVSPDNYGTIFLSMKENVVTESYIGNYFRNKVLLHKLGKQPELNERTMIKFIKNLILKYEESLLDEDVQKVMKRRDVADYYVPQAELSFPDGMVITFAFCYDKKSLTPGAAFKNDKNDYIVLLYPCFFECRDMDVNVFTIMHEIGHIRLGHCELKNQSLDADRRQKVMIKGGAIYTELNADLYASLNGAKMYTILKEGINKDYDKKYDYRYTNNELSKRYSFVLKNYRKLRPMTEGVILNDEDIYYNKEKFDNGETNICFITGHSGSGKSTMGNSMVDTKTEHYDMDDVIWNKERFTMSQLKEYGDLIHSFFNGPGKKYYYTIDDVKSGKVKAMDGNYEFELTNDFIDYAIGYAKSHKTTRFVIEGIWIYMFVKPSKLDDCAVYIKGTSATLSAIRAAKRDSKYDFPDKKDSLKRAKAFMGRFGVLVRGGVGSEDSGIAHEKYVKEFRNHFKSKNVNESVDNIFEESVKSTLDSDYKPKGKMKLASFRKVHITESVIDKYKKEYPFLKHVRCKDTEEYVCDGYIWFDNDELVAMVGSCEYTDDKTKWIVSLEITESYRGYGLSNQIVDYAVKSMNCKYLSVNKNNEIAKKIYDNYGFKVYHKSDSMYYMTIDDNVLNESVYNIHDNWCYITESSEKKRTAKTGEFEIEEEYFKVYNDRDYAYVKVKGVDKPLRGRSEVLIMKDDEVYLCFDNDRYRLPGGGWDKGESYEHAALREAKEESRINCTNIKYVTSRVDTQDTVPEKCKKENIPEEGYWYGYFTKVFIADYDKKFSGHIDKEDQDPSMVKTGKFYPFEEVKDQLYSEHREAIEKYLGVNDEVFKEDALDDDAFDMIDVMLEAADDSHIIRDGLYPAIEAVLKTKDGDKLFKRYVEEFIDRNTEKLHEPCPISLIPFTDNDKARFFSLFNLNEKECVKIIGSAADAVSSSANFRLVKQNPIFCVFYLVLRYYIIKKDESGINSTLAIHALASYPSVFSKYFKYGANPGIMRYTADHLTEKFIFKQEGHVFGALRKSIEASYKFLKPYFNEAADKEMIRYIQRIRNDQNSLIKKIANEYQKNYKAGKSVSTQNETYDTGALIDDYNNDTSKAETASHSIIISLLTNGIDLRILETASEIAQLSISELRLYLVKILTDSRSTEIEDFISAVLFIYLYDEGHTLDEIRSKQFLSFGISLFRKTNSNDKNIATIKKTLDKWAEETGIHSRYKREPTRIAYKKGIYWYIMLTIQSNL